MLVSKPRTWRPASLARIPLLPLAWFLIALTVFFCSAVAVHFYSIVAGFHGFFPIAAGNDDGLYWQVSGILAGGGSPPWVPNSYPVVLALIYRILAPDLFLGKVFSVLAGTLSVYVAVLLASSFPGGERYTTRDLRHPGNITGILLVCYPSLLFYSTQLVRDSYIVLCGVVAVYAAFQISQRPHFQYVALVVAALALEYALRPYAAISIATGLGLSLVFGARVPWRGRIGIAAAFLFLAGLVPLVAGKGLFAFNYIRPLLDPTVVSRFRELSYSTGGGAVGISINYSSPVGFVFSYGYSLLTLLVGPFAWQIHSIGQVVAMPEAIAMTILSITIFMSLKRKGKLDRRLFVLLLPALVLLMVMAVFADNTGTNTRLRILPWILLVIVFAVSRAGRGDGLTFRNP